MTRTRTGTRPIKSKKRVGSRARTKPEPPPRCKFCGCEKFVKHRSIRVLGPSPIHDMLRRFAGLRVGIVVRFCKDCNRMHDFNLIKTKRLRKQLDRVRLLK